MVVCSLFFPKLARSAALLFCSEGASMLLLFQPERRQHPCARRDRRVMPRLSLGSMDDKK